MRDGSAVILRCALLRALKDGYTHRSHPSRLAEDGSRLRMMADSNLFPVVPGMTMV